MTTDTERLLELAAEGDKLAINQLLQVNRRYLLQVVSARMDTRASARFDPSDVVQDTLTLACERLPDYLKNRKVPFLVWLRFLAGQRLIQLQRHHIGALRRSVTCETHRNPKDSDSEGRFLDSLAANITGPVAHAVRNETRQRLKAAIQVLRPRDREVLELRYLEKLNTSEIAGLLNINKKAVVTRHGRAIYRLQQLIELSAES